MPQLGQHLSTEPAVRWALAFWGGLAVVAFTQALPPEAQTAALVALAWVAMRGQHRLAALGVAGIIWLVELGFVIGSYGQLGLAHPISSVALLVGLAALAELPR